MPKLHSLPHKETAADNRHPVLTVSEARGLTYPAVCRSSWGQASQTAKKEARHIQQDTQSSHSPTTTGVHIQATLVPMGPGSDN